MRLLNIQQQGRERFCEAKLEKLNDVHEWVQQYHKLWTGRMKALRNFLELEAQEPASTKKTSKKKVSGINKSKK